MNSRLTRRLTIALGLVLTLAALAAPSANAKPQQIYSDHGVAVIPSSTQMPRLTLLPSALARSPLQLIAGGTLRGRAGALGDERRLPPLAVRQDGEVEVSGRVAVGMNGPRLFQHRADVVARGDVDDREHRHPGVAGELGRLAGRYRSLFGELPSETLGRRDRPVVAA